MKGIIVMNDNLNTVPDKGEPLPMLDRGIDDMESGLELPIDEAFDLIAELVEKRRSARI